MDLDKNRDAASDRAERLERASEIVAAAIFNARPYPQSWTECGEVDGGALRMRFMREGRKIVHEVLECVGNK